MKTEAGASAVLSGNEMAITHFDAVDVTSDHKSMLSTAEERSENSGYMISGLSSPAVGGCTPPWG